MIGQLQQTLREGAQPEYAGHFVTFAGLAYLVTRAVRTTPQRLAVLASCVAFAVTIELSQGLFYRAGVRWINVLIDSVAGFAGATIGWLVHRRTVSPTDAIISSTLGSLVKGRQVADRLAESDFSTG